MGKPNHKTRNPGARDRWRQAKREDRPKQTWVWNQVGQTTEDGTPVKPTGHWKHTYWHPASEQPAS